MNLTDRIAIVTDGAPMQRSGDVLTDRIIEQHRIPRHVLW